MLTLLLFDSQHDLRLKPTFAPRLFHAAIAFLILSGVPSHGQSPTDDQKATSAAATVNDATEQTLPISPTAGISQVVSESMGTWQSAGLTSTLRSAATLGALSLAPAALLLTTSFVRLSIVLGLLRQALGGANLPSQQVVTALTLCLTLLVMQPTWTKVYREAIAPYSEGTSEEFDWKVAWNRGVRPIRDFMSHQIQLANNEADVLMFARYAQEDTNASPQTYEEVPLTALLPAFVLSELKTAFLLGFQIYLPFLVVDLVVASVTTSVGMMMLPPAMVSLPIKLLLFVLVDGWHLVVGMLLDSFQTLP
ncbi:MAG: flagellar type III secretion system pore protein FliP [Planctomycetota bacterium]|nr:flagellar type III secretion system pore protein FliP [Planctomycetota bacterium]MDA1177374.1 flagellar type III secretion system pore protein FliP [Planctomycetota bacterium]